MLELLRNFWEKQGIKRKAFLRVLLIFGAIVGFEILLIYYDLSTGLNGLVKYLIAYPLYNVYLQLGYLLTTVKQLFEQVKEQNEHHKISDAEVRKMRGDLDEAELILQLLRERAASIDGVNKVLIRILTSHKKINLQEELQRFYQEKLNPRPSKSHRRRLDNRKRIKQNLKAKKPDDTG